MEIARTVPAVISLALSAAVLARAEDTPLNRTLVDLPDNAWVKVAECPADPERREVPPGRGASWVYHAAARVFVWYGGLTPTFSNALWTFDPLTLGWKLEQPHDPLFPPGRPGGGIQWALAYDGKRERVWMAAGVVGDRPMGDTQGLWSYDVRSAAFTAFEPAGGIRPRFYPTASAYDPSADRLVVAPMYFGEWAARENAGHTWVYDPAGNVWERRETKRMPGPGGAANRLVHAPSVSRMVYHDGIERITWTYDVEGNVWEKAVEPAPLPPRAFYAAASDPDGRQVLLHGGIGGEKGAWWAFSPRNSECGMLDDTWLYDPVAKRWSEAKPSSVPVARASGGASDGEGRLYLPFRQGLDHDPVHKVFLLCDADLGVWAFRWKRPEGWPPAGARVTEAGVTEARVTEARVTEARVTEARVTEARVTEARVTEAGVTEARVTEARVTEARVTEAGVTEAGGSKTVYRVEAGRERMEARPPEEFLRALRRGKERNERLDALAANSWLALAGDWPGGGEVPLAFDETNGVLLKYGGCNNDTSPYMHGYGNDLWLYDPVTETWHARRATDSCGAPRPRNGCTRAYSYDSLRGVVWFEGGTSGNELLAPMPSGWKGGPGQWRYDVAADRFELVPLVRGNPVPGNLQVLVYDPGEDVLIRPGEGEVWHLRAAGAEPTWIGFPVEGGPPVRYGAMSEYTYMVHCPPIGKNVLVQWCSTGRTASRPGGPAPGVRWREEEDGTFVEWRFQTWLYDARSRRWTDARPEPSPEGIDGRFGLCHDSRNGVIVLAGGSIEDGAVWIYHPVENRWERMAPANPPRGPVGGQMVYDSRHGVCIIGDKYLSGPWAYRYGPSPRSATSSRPK